MTQKTKEEIKIMKEGGKILARVMESLRKTIKPGVTTGKLDELAEALILKYNAKPSFLGYHGFPKSICASINEEVVHGIPSDKELKEGDIVSLDVGIFYKGFHTDAAATFPVGKISKNDKKLIDVTKKSLLLGLKEIKDGKRVGDISFSVQKAIEKQGFSVVKDCTGHGIGKNLHEDPPIPNFGKRGEGPVLKEGYTLAIEPMANAGDFLVKTAEDGWTIKTLDGKKSAHFELTVLVKKRGYENLVPIKS